MNDSAIKNNKLLLFSSETMASDVSWLTARANSDLHFAAFHPGSGVMHDARFKR